MKKRLTFKLKNTVGNTNGSKIFTALGTMAAISLPLLTEKWDTPTLIQSICLVIIGAFAGIEKTEKSNLKN